MSFSDLQLADPILKAVARCGYSAPTPIQEQAIPPALEGKDLIASAQTGTGKTAAFVLPALQRLTAPAPKAGRGPRVLVLTPTRELANQVLDAVRSYGQELRLRVGSVLGGVPYREQERLLSYPVDILVATPGRLIDHMERGRVNFSRLELLVLDEADRMLDMGFSQAVQTIADATPGSRQTLLFTATWDGAVQAVASRLLKEPVRIAVAGAKRTLDQIEQRVHAADDMRHKDRLLDHLIADSGMTRAIVFSGTKRHADQLASRLRAEGHAAEALHGDMSQYARNRAIGNMRRGRVRLLVATDVAARGIDVEGITHVINYDLPKNAEDYVHRIGRTGRAGASGVAISFASPADVASLRQIERYLGHSLSRHVIPGLEPRLNPRTDSGRARRPSVRSGPGVSTPSFRNSRRDSQSPSGGYSARDRREGKSDGSRAGDFRREPSGTRKRWA